VEKRADKERLSRSRATTNGRSRVHRPICRITASGYIGETNYNSIFEQWSSAANNACKWSLCTCRSNRRPSNRATLWCCQINPMFLGHQIYRWYKANCLLVLTKTCCLLTKKKMHIKVLAICNRKCRHFVQVLKNPLHIKS